MQHRKKSSLNDFDQSKKPRHGSIDETEADDLDVVAAQKTRHALPSTILITSRRSQTSSYDKCACATKSTRCGGVCGNVLRCEEILFANFNMGRSTRV
jgi:hypothetical protein